MKKVQCQRHEKAVTVDVAQLLESNQEALESVNRDLDDAFYDYLEDVTSEEDFITELRSLKNIRDALFTVKEYYEEMVGIKK